MFKPQFQLTPPLVSEIAHIERLYGQIEALKIPQQLELNLTRDNLVTSAYASNKIEGNPLTLPEVTNLLLDDRVPVNRSEKEVVNYYELLQQLPKFSNEKFTVEKVKEIHKKLMTGVDHSAGQIRNIKVIIGKYSGEPGNVSLTVKHDPPYHTKEEISKHLQELLDWYNNDLDWPVVIRAGIFHHHFVYIHPFEDGNGRVCRLLTALLFIRSGYQINKYFILDDYYDIDRHEYSDKLHSADIGDKTSWLMYFAEGVKHSMHSALFKFKEAVKTLSVKDRPSPKEQAVLDIVTRQKESTSGDIAKELSVTRQQAHNLLSGLVEKGLLEKKGSTKSSYYILK